MWGRYHEVRVDDKLPSYPDDPRKQAWFLPDNVVIRRTSKGSLGSADVTRYWHEPATSAQTP